MLDSFRSRLVISNLLITLVGLLVVVAGKARASSHLWAREGACISTSSACFWSAILLVTFST